MARERVRKVLREQRSAPTPRLATPSVSCVEAFLREHSPCVRCLRRYAWTRAAAGARRAQVAGPIALRNQRDGTHGRVHNAAPSLQCRETIAASAARAAQPKRWRARWSAHGRTIYLVPRDYRVQRGLCNQKGRRVGRVHTAASSLWECTRPPYLFGVHTAVSSLWSVHGCIISFGAAGAAGSIGFDASTQGNLELAAVAAAQVPSGLNLRVWGFGVWGLGFGV